MDSIRHGQNYSGPIALCYGTRPQIIKASVIRRALAELGPVLAVDTGQHYDYELNALLYEQLSVADPDYCLEVGSSTHAEQTAGILTRAEALFRETRPGAVVVIGDTNSTLGSALAAAKLRIPVVHVEAGLRARDILMAEEINRRVVDSFAQVLCTPSSSATRRMRAEHPDAHVIETGDVAHDVLRAQLACLPGISRVLPGGTEDGLVFATLHRAELTDDVDALEGVLDVLASLPVASLLALHPRTRAVLRRHGRREAGWGSLTIVPPVGYLESLALAREARLIVTDSGGVQREAYWLGTPCITVRAETEWTETVESGANRLVAPGDPEGLRECAQRLLSTPRASWDRVAYGDGFAAGKIARAAASLLGRSPDAVPA